MGVRSFALYRKVIFPAALPAFISGLKQGWSFAWRALMSGEVMSASVGLGYTLILGRDLADINQVMTVMLVITKEFSPKLNIAFCANEDSNKRIQKGAIYVTEKNSRNDRDFHLNGFTCS